VVTKKPRKNKKNHNHNRISASQPSTSHLDKVDFETVDLDNVINSVAHKSDPTQLINEQQEKPINDLKHVISRQNVMINTVVSGLNFLLSMFNIDEVSVPLSPMDAVICDDTILPINQCSNANLPVPTDTSVNDHATVNQSYSSAAARNTQREQLKQQRPKFQQSAVYTYIYIYIYIYIYSGCCVIC